MRDLAFAHVKAIEVGDAAAEKRVFITAGYFSNEEIADTIRDAHPELKERLPAKGVKGGEYPEGGLYEFDNSRSKEVLGVTYRSLKESVLDTVKTLQEIGA